MRLSRASTITFLALFIGSALVIASPKSWLDHTVAQNTDIPAPPPKQGVPRWIQQLNLTPTQTQRMQTISNKYKNQISQSGNALRQAQTELGQMMAGAATSEILRQKHRQVESLRQQVGNLRFESLLEMREVLTSEQRRQIVQNMQNRMGNFRRPRPNQMPQPPQ